MAALAVCVSVSLRSWPWARAGPWVRKHVRHSRYSASSVIGQLYVGFLSLSVVVVAWHYLFFANYCL